VAEALRNTTVAEIERRLDQMRERESATQRTSVLTHTVWIPREWARAVARVMDALGARVPSRTILLYPDPQAKESRLDAEVAHDCFVGATTSVRAERARIWLRGETAKAPASVVAPLQIADLPAFLRWRGKPAFGSTQFEQLVGVSDRLIVDSSEWGVRLPAAYRQLAEWFDRIAVTDVAWARTLPVRAGLAALWPGIKQARTLGVEGPRADAVLLHSWLQTRLKRELTLRHVAATALGTVEVEGERVRTRRRLERRASDLLSAALDLHGRDRIYEAATRAV
jgi:glucose-6-phosphate dehydrogenase assembly protein OpcA